MAAGGIAAGLVYGLSTGDTGRELPRVVAGAMVQLPGVWVLAAITLALFGIVPRLAAGGWAAWAACMSIFMLGALGQHTDRLLDISPFTHIPKLPGADASVAPLLWLTVIAATLATAGLASLTRRDVGPV